MLGFLLVIWILGLMAVVVGVLVIVAQVQQVPVEHPQLTDPITPVTGLAALVLFMILMVTSSYTGWTQLLTAVIGAVAAPMVFELPFDLIVMTRTYPPVPPHPALYRAVFFVPLLLVEVTTLALLTWPPAFRVTRAALVLLASMFAVFAGWMLLTGFAYPAAPLPIAANVASNCWPSQSWPACSCPREHPRPRKPSLARRHQEARSAAGPGCDRRPIRPDRGLVARPAARQWFGGKRSRQAEPDHPRSLLRLHAHGQAVSF